MMPLGFSSEREPDFVKPFCWAPEGFTYLGVKVTPKISQLYGVNVKPIVKHMKRTHEMVGLKKLPVSLSWQSQPCQDDHSSKNDLPSIHAFHISKEK